MNGTEPPPQLLPCPDGTWADPSIGCVQVPKALVSSNTSLSQLMLQAGHGLMTALALGAAAAMIYGALHVVTSAGNEEQMEKGKRIVFWSTFGLMAALLAKLGIEGILRIL